MKSIKSIQTYFRGYKFRSRLEARWAVYFDALGIEWEYEPEGFDLGDAGWYLPDFYLPELDAWIEIKPKNGDRKEVFDQLVGMMRAGAAEHGRAWGLFGDPLDHKWMMPTLYESRANIKQAPGWYDEWGECSIEFHKDDDGWFVLTGFGMQDLKSWVFKNGGLKDAIVNYSEKQKARSARFEHGETP